MTSGGGKGIQDPLNSTATTPNLTMNSKGKMQMMTSSTLREERGGDDSSSRFTKNRVTGKNVVLFNDRPVKDAEVPSNGDNLGGNDKMSNNDDNGRSAGDDWDGRGDNGRKAEWEEDNSRRSNGKSKIELDNNDGAEGEGEVWQDNNENYIDKDNNDYDIRWGSGPAKRRRGLTLTTLVDDHALDGNDL